MVSAAGRLTSHSVANDSQTRAYNAAGELATYTLGSGSINYGYDAEGSPTSINYSTLNIGASLNPGVGGAGNIPVRLANTYRRTRRTSAIGLFAVVVLPDPFSFIAIGRLHDTRNG